MLIKVLLDFILGVLWREGSSDANGELFSYLRKMMTKLCLKVHMKSDSAIELAFP